MVPIKSLMSVGVAMLLLAAVGTSDAATIPPGGLLDFAVMRDGKQVGTHVLTFRQSDDRLDVTIKTRIAVKLAFITVFRFDHDGEEVWRDGKLVRMETRTNDDGTAHTLQVSPDRTGKLRVVGDGKEMLAEPDSVPASLWNPVFIGTNALMDSLVGKPLDIAVADAGEDTVTVKGQPVAAHHYSMTGELARELWYDASGTLVRMTLTAKDGSDVQYVLR